MRLVTDDSAYETTDVPGMYIGTAAERHGASKSVSEETFTADAWTPEVDMILSAMEAANPMPVERRSVRRTPLRTQAHLTLFAQSPLLGPTILFTRDVTEKGIGFITRERVPLGYNGLVQFTNSRGKTVTQHGQVYRCREAINGWYEGSLRFAVSRAF
jgi:hypothetical protein